MPIMLLLPFLMHFCPTDWLLPHLLEVSRPFAVRFWPFEYSLIITTPRNATLRPRKQTQ